MAIYVTVQKKIILLIKNLLELYPRLIASTNLTQAKCDWMVQCCKVSEPRKNKYFAQREAVTLLLVSGKLDNFVEKRKDE